ncbi:tRNA lysidine(34) synthetase TilS [Thermophagus xiamenensis]|uniref:tRNA(Ile)-lysidine synthase n=1 Tax=Thermophagus xiamenensis TaxID=385682 RepID=A0A1I2FJK7_9BACT|nr:tRNA lysidine(34) synthetase TilS [Thermophagus xiamenensis]SFF04907.1 tRNA(Ile)-lysidine synthase [Thermophagus xiamenensis]
MIQQQVEETLCSYGINKNDPLLVALSGGPDSMALLHLLNASGYHCTVAHCNFHLRGEESDEDTRFVLDYCRQNNIPFFVKHFNTLEEAKRRGISIEMAARDLRYSWFYELLKSENLRWIVTGHHGDDMIETFFLNLVRGTGLRGLKGMQVINGKVVRPMLSVGREQIEDYCRIHNIPFRTDSSNSDTSFQRNRIRHVVMPVFKDLNPGFFYTMMQNFRNLQEAWQIVETEVERVKKDMVAGEGDIWMIPIKLIAQHPQKNTVLFELLRPYGFNRQTVAEIIDGLEGTPGKQFFSDNYRLIRDRFNLVVVPKEKDEQEYFYINSDETEVLKPVPLKIRRFVPDNDFRFSRSPQCIHLDADMIEFPLTLRHWKPGDQFRPLGMETFKKLSDFFVDEKFSLVDKERTWLLLSGDQIVWVVGRRIDDRFKVTAKTKNILEIKMEEG